MLWPRQLFDVDPRKVLWACVQANDPIELFQQLAALFLNAETWELYGLSVDSEYFHKRTDVDTDHNFERPLPHHDPLEGRH